MKGATKHILIFLLPAVMLYLTGCIKTQRDPDQYLADKGYPLGTFTGNCLKLRKKAYDYSYDTIKVNLTLTLSTNTGYRLTGDTTSWHAGSYGSFSEDFASIVFDDLSLPASATTKRTHLSGLYSYDYEGSTLIIKPAAPQSDTLKFIYNFKKIN